MVQALPIVGCLFFGVAFVLVVRWWRAERRARGEFFESLRRQVNRRLDGLEALNGSPRSRELSGRSRGNAAKIDQRMAELAAVMSSAR